LSAGGVIAATSDGYEEAMKALEQGEARVRESTNSLGQVEVALEKEKSMHQDSLCRLEASERSLEATRGAEKELRDAYSRLEERAGDLAREKNQIIRVARDEEEARAGLVAFRECASGAIARLNDEKMDVSIKLFDEKKRNAAIRCFEGLRVKRHEL